MPAKTSWKPPAAGPLEQVEEKEYAAQLREDGMETIRKYGIACNRKSCRMLVE